MRNIFIMDFPHVPKLGRKTTKSQQNAYITMQLNANNTYLIVLDITL